MTFLRKFLILVHRYLGIVLSLLFVVWFASGIAMMYAGGMPSLTREVRLERLDPVDFNAVQYEPDESAEQVVLLTVMGRPAYRIDGRTIFADTGEELLEVDQDGAILIASQFMNTPRETVRYTEFLLDA